MMNVSERILIGVTVDSLLQKKSYGYYIEPYEIRSERVVSFLKRLNPAINAEIFPLSDPCGKAVSDTDI